MKLLQPVIYELDNTMVVLPAGSIILEESDTIDVDPKSLERDEKQYSPKHLAGMVERWIRKNKQLVDSGKVTTKEWDYITSHLLQLMRALHSNDKEAIMAQKDSLSSKNINNPRLAKLHKAVLGVYNEIGSKLGSYEIMGNKIFQREEFEKLAGILNESLNKILLVID